MARTAAAPRAAKAGYKILLDTPATNPALGYDGIARALGNIALTSDPRFAIGIFGHWGSGKTTLMEAIEANVQGPKAVTVRFSAWRYERDDHLIVPLLDTIRDALVEWGEQRPKPQQSLPMETARKIGRVGRALAAGISFKAGLPGVFEASFEATRAMEHAAAAGEVDAMVSGSVYHAAFRALRDAFEEFAGHGARRIVVFIDDLDRCLPENALEVLESMKLFFDLEGFVFVVGLDREIVERAVASKYPDEPAAERQRERRILGDDYVEKIFQVPYTLAPVGVEQLDALLAAVFAEADLPPAQRSDFERVVVPHLNFLVTDGSINPREVKRYLNAYTIATSIDSTLDPNLVLVVLTLRFRPEWDDIESALLGYGGAFVAALESFHKGRADALSDLGLTLLLPDDFVTYTSTGQPGRGLVAASGIERYFLNVGTSTARNVELLVVLPQVGALRSQVAGLKERPGDANSTLSQATSVLRRLSPTLLGESPVVERVLADRDAFMRIVSELEKELQSPDFKSDAGRIAPKLDELDQLVSRMMERLLQLYRAGTGARIGTTQDVPVTA